MSHAEINEGLEREKKSFRITDYAERDSMNTNKVDSREGQKNRRE